MKGKILPASFFTRPDVAIIAKELLGKCLATNFDGNLTVLRIVESEAYNGIIDKASHAYNNRKTNRTKVMFEKGGVAYVYICYGIHDMFNIVTNVEDIPHAILIRAGEPVAGLRKMMERTNKNETDFSISRGHGNVCKALGIHTGHTGISLINKEIYLYDDAISFKENEIGISPRIGVEYSGDAALLPYRFYVKGNKYVSGKWKK